MSTYDNPPNKPKKICLDCVNDKKYKQKKWDTKKLKIKNFIKKHWISLIMVTIAIMTLLHTMMTN